MIPSVLLEYGACRGMGPDEFYRDSDSAKNSTGHHPLPADHVCFRCPVIKECRGYALKSQAYGAWGGLTEYELFQERKRLRIRQPSSGTGPIVINGKGT